jgi:sterol desaturase/sphingolipid hydroxylase (fatty acid hydroxylase superfamily)
MHRLTKWLTPALTLGAFGALAWAEERRPLRKRVASREDRFAENVAMAAAAAVATALIQRPLLARAKRSRGGLLAHIELPRPLRTVAGVLLLDYTLWWWHWMNHRVPPLWLFHRVHHADLDLDVSTGIRFHPGEMALSAIFRAAQVRILGVNDEALRLWQRLLLVSILFHHSNLRLPEAADRALAKTIVTPRMHGIHHSNREEETNSNWSSLLSWWDWLHGTIRLDRPQSEITIGVPGA